MSEIKPGDVRVLKRGEGKALAVVVGVWATQDRDHLRIDITGLGKGHTTVTNKPDSVRYHRTLFRDIRKVLIENGVWEFGDEGSETEETKPESAMQPGKFQTKVR